MSPILKEALREKKYDVIHDPFKSDIYSLGLIILFVYMKKIGKDMKEIKKCLRDPESTYQTAKNYNLNQYII